MQENFGVLVLGHGSKLTYNKRTVETAGLPWSWLTARDSRLLRNSALPKAPDTSCVDAATPDMLWFWAGKST